MHIEVYFALCSPIFVLWNPGSLVVNYPYDDDKDGLNKYSQSPDDKVFQQVSKAYSQVTGHLNLSRVGIMPTCGFMLKLKTGCEVLVLMKGRQGLKSGIQQFWLLSSHSCVFLCVQENPLMHNGHPCEDLYPSEYFKDGITNGASWYNVPGVFLHLPLSPHTFLFTDMTWMNLNDWIKLKAKHRHPVRNEMNEFLSFRWHAGLELLKHQLFWGDNWVRLCEVPLGQGLA